MRNPLSLSRIVRAAVLAAVVGAVALPALPAQAQNRFDNGPGFYDGQRFHNGPFVRRPFVRPFPAYPVNPGFRGVCLPDWQLRRVLNSAGFFNISFFGYSRVWVQARAVRGPWVWRLTVNRCTGNIVNAVRVARR